LVELWLVIFVYPNVRTLAYEQIRPESRQTPVPVQNHDGLEVFGSGGMEKFERAGIDLCMIIIE
jgi:hypothetical protein